MDPKANMAEQLRLSRILLGNGVASAELAQDLGEQLAALVLEAARPEKAPRIPGGWASVEGGARTAEEWSERRRQEEMIGH